MGRLMLFIIDVTYTTEKKNDITKIDSFVSTPRVDLV